MIYEISALVGGHVGHVGHGLINFDRYRFLRNIKKRNNEASFVLLEKGCMFYMYSWCCIYFKLGVRALSIDITENKRVEYNKARNVIV